MKRFIFTILVSFLSITAMSTTYYWVGGATGGFTTAASWNTALNGSGSSRSSALGTDVLIFDGSNIGGATPTTGTITPAIPTGSISFGQLKLQNGANVVFQRSTNGGSTYTLNGDGTSADDFTIDATSSLKLTSPTANYNFKIVMGVANTTIVTGSIAGTIRLDDAGLNSTIRLEVPNAGALVFTNGSNLYFNNSYTANSAFTSITVAAAIVFQSGSNLIYQPSSSVAMYSGLTSPAMPFVFNKGSNFVFEGPLTGFVDQKVLSNVIVRNNAQVSFDGVANNIDNLTIESGAKLLFKITQPNPIAGNIVNNGTLGAVDAWTSAALIMVGTTAQSISGSGTFQTMGAFHVATDADVTLQANLTVGSTTASSSSSSICGKLNFGTTNTLSASIPSGGSVGNIAFKSSSTLSSGSVATINSGSNTITLPSSVYASNPSTVNTLNITLGALVSGPGIPDNAYVVNTNSGSNSITISKSATATTTTGIITITIKPASFITANAGGIDGSIPSSSVKTIATSTNLVFNGATTSPFSSVLGTISNLTINAPITTNKVVQSISGTLTLGTGNLTIRATDTLRLTTATDIAGSPSSSKYIISEVSGTNAGVLRMDNFTTAKTFPIGTATKYMPVTLTPASASDFAVSVFQGATNNGTLGGVAVSTENKANIVDAVWTVNRINGTGDCSLQLNWDASLEGATFSSNPSDVALGISRYDGALWSTFTKSAGSISSKSVTQTFSSFSPFIIGSASFTLPVTLTNISATVKPAGVELVWETANEDGIRQYVVEKSSNGIDFDAIGFVNASNKGKYIFTDGSASTGVFYYRLKIVSVNGEIAYSKVLMVKTAAAVSVSVYPNPVANSITISGLSGKTSLKIINTAGVTLKQINTAASTLSIDVNDLKAGIYMIQAVDASGKVKTLSFVKR